ncbi:cytochrome c [Burkholderia glumae]|uniref:c-type cytochrome n=1 Tax=Burkholderia glumae TaxID=337 RepID=UPI0003A40C36|nr:cytochrome c [Burkholderia glumae]MCM2492731.1 cytochrome c [Burkholderia glumae]MCM2544580.1 cytochrome c [Burkholderia glumae]MCQ0034115.1 cytochrome c [Burkholderia glumae]MCQ0038478.1 cytochrome c [Burkholderia glumae]PJO20501.1 cytochrome C [Burkholderia glumae AU6208]
MLKRTLLSLWLLLGTLAHGTPAQPAITIASHGKLLTFTAQTLLARADAADIHVTRDVSYGKPMTYRAVPLADLIDGASLPPDGVIETRATDGFAAQLPMDLVRNRDPARAVAYLAVEDPARPWPKLPGKPVSAGPFYLVWVGAQAASVRGEQWPYQVARFTIERAPVARWPALAVDSALPATDPVRAGQRLFITQCLACHRFNGAGSSNTGPDLGKPANPVDYFQPGALHRYIRNPASLRDWPGRAMPAFSPDQLSDREIDLIIGYLAYMAHRR